MKHGRKLLSVIVSIVLIATALVGCGSKESSDKTDTKTTPTVAPTVTTAPTTAAPTQAQVEYPKTVTIGYFTMNDDNNLVKENGWLEEELSKSGTTVKWVNFQAGRDMNNAILSKSIDFAGGIGDPPVAIAASTSIPYQIFWVSTVLGESEALVAKNSAKISSIKDLKGKKIATTVSSTSHYSLLSALELEGLTAKDVKIIDLNPTDIVAAWKRGDIDAAYTWDPSLGELYADGTKLISSKELATKGAPTAGYNIVSDEFASKYPQVIELYLKALIKAHDLYAADPDKSAEQWAKANSITKEEALKQAKGNVWLTVDEELSSAYLGTSAAKGNSVNSLKKIGDFLVDQKSLEKKLDASAYDKYINPSYLEKVKAEQ